MKQLKKAQPRPTLVYLSEEQHMQLRILAGSRLTTVSGVLRQIIDDYLKGGVKS